MANPNKALYRIPPPEGTQLCSRSPSLTCTPGQVEQTYNKLNKKTWVCLSDPLTGSPTPTDMGWYNLVLWATHSKAEVAHLPLGQATQGLATGLLMSHTSTGAGRTENHR